MVSTTTPPHPPPPPPPPPPDTVSSNGIRQSTNIGDGSPQSAQRRSSLGFLRRMKSTERVSAARSSTGAKLTKKQQALHHEEMARRERERREEQARAPQLPDLYNGISVPSIRSFGDEALTSLSPPPPPGGARATSSPESRSVPVPPIPGTYINTRGELVDPYARTESMTNRGRYSFASTAVSTINSPRRVRRRKDPTPFNILVIGARNSGKTSFIEFLRNSLAEKKPHARRGHIMEEPAVATSTTHTANSAFESHYIETDIDGESVGLTLWDSQGLEKNVVDLQLREMLSFLESKFEDTFAEEMKVVRAPGVQDTHIHCVFMILDPVRLDGNISAITRRHGIAGSAKNLSNAAAGGLDERFELQILRALQKKTTVIPVISKADTVTTPHMVHLKKAVWNSIKGADLDPLEALGLDVDAESDSSSSASDAERPEEEARAEREHEAQNEADNDSDGSFLIKQSNVEPTDTDSSKPTEKEQILKTSPENRHRRTPSSPVVDPSSTSRNSEIPYLPLSIISPDVYDPGTIGRKFPWGMADPYNETHCDFGRLKDAVFGDWRGELREASRETFYEGWRTSRLNHNNKRRTGPGERRR